MKKLVKNIQIPASREEAFDKFVHQLNAWWPREYTWSQQQLVEIKIDTKKNGLCTEIGPFNFRCDWGRVVDNQANSKVIIKWQISPLRVPEPDPAKASELTVHFKEGADSGTTLELIHAQFENHGEGAEGYLKAMDSGQGWDYILQKYKEYCMQ